MKESYSLDIQWLRLNCNCLYIYLINDSSYTLNFDYILYIFVLRAKDSTTFPSKVGFFSRVVQKYTKFANHHPPEVTPLPMILKLINNS